MTVPIAMSKLDSTLTGVVAPVSDDIGDQSFGLARIYMYNYRVKWRETHVCNRRVYLQVIHDTSRVHDQ